MERQVRDITSGKESPAMVDHARTVGSQRERDRSAVRPIQITLRTDAATHNAGYGGVMTLGSKDVQDQRIPDEGRTTGGVHQSVRVHGVREHSMVSLTSSSSRQDEVDEGPRVSGAGQRDVDQIRSSGGQPVDPNVLARAQSSSTEWRTSGISLTFRHLAGELNVAADGLSRQAHTHADWKLNRQLFRKIWCPSADSRRGSISQVLRTLKSITSSLTTTTTGRWGQMRSYTAGADWGLPYAYPPPILIGQGSPEVACRLLVYVR